MTIDLLARSPLEWLVYGCQQAARRYRHWKHPNVQRVSEPLTLEEKLEATTKDETKRFGTNGSIWSNLNAFLIIALHVFVVKWLAVYFISSFLMFAFFAPATIENNWILQVIGYCLGLTGLSIAFKTYLFEMIFYGGSSAELHVLESWFSKSEHYSFEFMDTPDKGFREYSRFGTKQLWWKRRDKWKAEIQLKEVPLPDSMIEFFTKEAPGKPRKIVKVKTKFYYRPLVGYGRGSRYFMIPEPVREMFVKDVVYEFLTAEISKLTSDDFEDALGDPKSLFRRKFVNLFSGNSSLSRVELMLGISIEDPTIVDYELMPEEQAAIVQQSIADKVMLRANELAAFMPMKDAVRYAQVMFGQVTSVMHDYHLSGDPEAMQVLRNALPTAVRSQVGGGGGRGNQRGNTPPNNPPQQPPTT